MVQIIPYQSGWPEEFRQIAYRLRQGLGEMALRIDHIGSTAVPGLAAKDVIDIQVTVAGLDDRLRQAIEALGLAGMEGMQRDHHPPGAAGPDSDWEKLYFHEAPGERRAHIHVRVAGRPNQRYPLLFRDYLRAHTASAAAYAELKRRLASLAMYSGGVPGLADPHAGQEEHLPRVASVEYSEVKDPAVDLIYLAAEDWAAATGWEPGPADF